MRRLLDDFPYGAETASVAPVAPDTVNRIVLGADTPRTVAIPTGARFVQVAPGGSLPTFVRFGSTVSMGPGDVTDGTAGEPAFIERPFVRRVPDGTTSITLQSAAGYAVALSFWS